MPLTYPTPSVLVGSSAENLNGAYVLPLNVRPMAPGTSPSSSPTNKAQFGNLIRRIFIALNSSLELMAVADGTLTIGVYPGYYRDDSNVDALFEGDEAVALTDDATNYVYLDRSTGTLTIDTTSFPGTLDTFFPIAVFECADGAIVTSDYEADRRGLYRNYVQTGSSSPTGTNATTFTLDQDNAGAGADQQIRFNRGSTDAEDAAIVWDETADGFVAVSRHSSLTLCPFSVGSLYVNSALAYDSNGAAKVAAAVAGDGLSHSSGVLSANVDGTSIETSGGALQIKAGGVSTAKLSDALADSLVQISIADVAGATGVTVTIQAKDAQGNNLAEVVSFRLGVYQSSSVGALATDATITDGGAGSAYDVGAEFGLAAGKLLDVQTDATGLLEIDVTDPNNETVYLKAMPGPGSKWIKCNDIGTVTIS